VRFFLAALFFFLPLAFFRARFFSAMLSLLLRSRYHLLRPAQWQTKHETVCDPVLTR
jgi:hypothetical protein